MCEQQPLNDKQKAILKAASECFLKHGYQACSMDEIAETAGVSKQTIYNNFESKEGLFLGIMGQMCGAMYDPELRVPDPNRPPAETLVRFAKQMMQMMTRPEGLAFFRIVIAEGPHIPELAQTFWDNGPKRTGQDLAEVFKGFHEAGTLHVENPELTARQFLACMKADLYFQHVLNIQPLPTKEDFDAYINHLVQMFVKGLQK